jgi:hypothetical protein
MNRFIMIAALAVSVHAAAAESAKLAAYTGKKEMAFALDIVAPWADGGKLTVNLPEHLQFQTIGNSGIIREYNKELKGWKIADDGLSATLEADSPFQAGVHVKGEAKVSGKRVEFSIKVENNGKTVLPGVNGLFCHHYSGLSGFPQHSDHFKHSFVLLGGKVTALSDIATQKADVAVKGGNVSGCPQRPVDASSFAAKYGGAIEKDLDAALIAVTALDGKRKFLLAWTPGMCVLSNSQIPCVHGDPYFGTADPGKSVEARGVIVFTEEPLEDAVAALQKEGAGAAPRK